MAIHETAIVSPKARLGREVEIGAYSVVGDGVRLADGVKLHSHTVVVGNTELGERVEIFPFAAIGNVPQDTKYKGEESKTEIGSGTKIREYVSIHPGTAQDKLETIIGKNCLIMAGSHIAHDCVLGNNVIIVNDTLLAGHVVVGDHAVLGGDCAVRQYVRIGRYAMVDARSAVSKSIIPYARISGRDHPFLNGVNVVGLKRHNFPREVIHSLSDAFKALFDLSGELLMEERLESVKAEFADIAEVLEVVEFIASASRSLGICRPAPR